MFRNRLFRRVVVGTTIVAAVVAVVAARDLPLFLLGLLAGAALGVVVGWIVVRSVMRERQTLSDYLREGFLRESDASIPAPGDDDELTNVVNDVVVQSRRRRNEFSRREAELEQNSALLETVLGTMVEGVLVVDEVQQVLFMNAALRALLNIERKDILGRPLVEVVREPGIQEAVGLVSGGQESVQVEFESGRQQKTVSLTAAALGSSRFQGVVLVLHDVSELRRLEQMRREFVSNVSHELKTPLTSIQAYADTLLDGAIDDSDSNRVFLQRIVQQSERLQSLIVDLLSLAKIEAQSEVFDIQSVDVDHAIRTCVESHVAVAETKGVALERSKESALKVMCDPDGLSQILDNLTDNALNYTPEGGRVTIGARRDGGCCVVSVADTGIGISKEQQPRIFERFYRADKARSREVGGTGLGLAIVKHLCQAFGGSVSIASELGAGSNFEVQLPIAPAMGQKSPVSQVAKPEPPG